ncbi:hypothetical protein ILUMI_19753 [Ignelater luminosus]|uniref:Uncharacterized protein n=1 Tax=Ignelater luminosus TaxID=2038154 RepID=A0A8K0CMC3_IGNLU|nr:hypothetical protein ILUMI_19753 [Ignelater luminosus]
MSYEAEQDCLLRLLREVEEKGEDPIDDEGERREKNGKKSKKQTLKRNVLSKIKTRKCNIVTPLLSVRPCAKNAKTAYECWNLFFCDEHWKFLLKIRTKGFRHREITFPDHGMRRAPT